MAKTTYLCIRKLWTSDGYIYIYYTTPIYIYSTERDLTPNTYSPTDEYSKTGFSLAPRNQTLLYKKDWRRDKKYTAPSLFPAIFIPSAVDFVCAVAAVPLPFHQKTRRRRQFHWNDRNTCWQQRWNMFDGYRLPPSR